MAYLPVLVLPGMVKKLFGCQVWPPLVVLALPRTEQIFWVPSLAYPRSWPSLGRKNNFWVPSLAPLGLGRPSEGKKCSGYKVCPPVLALPGMEKNSLGTKFGPPVVLALLRTEKKMCGYQVWPTPVLALPTPTLPHPRSSPFAVVAPLRQRLAPLVTDDQNSVLDGLKVRTLEEILQLKRNEDW